MNQLRKKTEPNNRPRLPIFMKSLAFLYEFFMRIRLMFKVCVAPFLIYQRNLRRIAASELKTVNAKPSC